MYSFLGNLAGGSRTPRGRHPAHLAACAVHMLVTTSQPSLTTFSSLRKFTHTQKKVSRTVLAPEGAAAKKLSNSCSVSPCRQGGTRKVAGLVAAS